MSHSLQYSKILFNVKIASGIVSGIIEINNHICQSERRKNGLELRMNNEPVPIPKKITNLINDVMNEMKLSPEDRSLIKPFLITGLQPKAVGYSKMKPGSFLGIPEAFYFENYPYVVSSNYSYMVEGTEFPPTSSISQRLKQTSFLSTDAKKFGIAREIYESRHSHIFVLSFIPVFLSAAALFILVLAQRCKSCFIKQYPLIYSVVTIPVEAVLFILLRNKFRVYSEGKADFEAANLGLAYIHGGIEYYEKMVGRHKTLKRLSKDFPFNDEGDYNTTGLQPQHMSLLRRIAYLSDLLKATKTNNKKPVVWSYVFS